MWRSRRYAGGLCAATRVLSRRRKPGPARRTICATAPSARGAPTAAAASRVLGPLLNRARRLSSFPQPELLDFARRGLRHPPEDDPPRSLESREVLPAVLDQLLLGHARARLHFDERARRLAPLGICLGDDDSVKNCGLSR